MTMQIQFLPNVAFSGATTQQPSDIAFIRKSQGDVRRATGDHRWKGDLYLTGKDAGHFDITRYVLRCKRLGEEKGEHYEHALQYLVRDLAYSARRLGRAGFVSGRPSHLALWADKMGLRPVAPITLNIARPGKLYDAPSIVHGDKEGDEVLRVHLVGRPARKYLSLCAQQRAFFDGLKKSLKDTSLEQILRDEGHPNHTIARKYAALTKRIGRIHAAAVRLEYPRLPKERRGILEAALTKLS